MKYVTHIQAFTAFKPILITTFNTIQLYKNKIVKLCNKYKSDIDCP